MIGITSYGAYIPRLRLNRMSIVQAMGWFAPAIMTVAQGERSVCNWDEDALTMAVAASRDCLTGMDKKSIDTLYLASTTLPFADRQNAGIVSSAINLGKNIITSDFTGSQKSATTALVTALDSIKSGERKNILVAASDRRETKTACFQEMWYGDGAASLMLGSDEVIAEYLGGFSLSCDFADHYRGSLNRYDYGWEERWARDAGYSKIIPEAIAGLFDKLKITMDDVDKLIFPCIFKGVHKKIAKNLGAAEKTVDNLHEVCGETGTAHPLVMLVSALETASPGDLIVVAGYGQGCSALCFKVTENIKNLPARSGFKGSIENGRTFDNYMKWLVFRDLVRTETGIRAEQPTQTAMTVLWRKNKMILGLVGGKCRECGTPQFPKMDICVNPECGAHGSQDDYEFAERPAKIKTFTADMLAVSVDPPAKYGLVQFDEGGRFMADFTDCEMDDLKIGVPMHMTFRRRATDKERGFTNYFWKAAPVPGAADAIRFDGRVAVITGAGGGLGRVYALELAKRGAKIVVNDLGGTRDGAGEASASPAEKVVGEIKELGGEAVANFDNVATPEGGENIIKSAVDAFGGVDILINNAGILRDKTILKMEPENWQAVLDVHLNGAYNVTRPAFRIMREKGYGRIIMTASAAGLYGNFGQTNYSAAKMALVGLMNSLRIEGRKYDINVNTVAPLAASRLTEDVMPPEMFERSKPEYVSPLVLFLCSEKCSESGKIFNAGIGHFNRAAVLTGPGVSLGDAKNPPSIETIHENWDRINNLEDAKELDDLNAALQFFMTPPGKKSEKPKSTGSLDVNGVFEKMAGAFDPGAAEGVDVVFQYVISGSSGGSWYCAIKDCTCEVRSGAHEKPGCTLKISDADFMDLMSGKLPAMQAFTSGQLVIEGDVMKSQLIEKLFKMG